MGVFVFFRVDFVTSLCNFSSCQKKEYLKDLPTVSIIIPFYDDHLSTLVRTVHSVINRSPSHLLREVIMVNDFSSKQFLYDELREYIAKNFKNVHLIELPERQGLIRARMAGARAATSDILIFLDSHCEASTNWLPPLLEPIALDYKVCVCPFIDVISWNNFQYRAQDEGARGIFNWKFLYKRVPIRPGDRDGPSDLFPSPIMAGGLFAISAKFFWELGGYDEGLDIWGGEQYELSFKIWQCGGTMYDAPCSRVGHVYRGPARITKPARQGKDFMSINFKRVAEVWMDEYAEYLYEHMPSVKRADPGDLTKQKAIREKWQCKPFKWFIEEVAPDLVEKYPPRNPPPFASGAIQSLANPLYCVDTLMKRHQSPVGLYLCSPDLVNPSGTQKWRLTDFRDIRNDHFELCIDVNMNGRTDEQPATMWACHQDQGNQLMRYDLDTKQIKAGKEEAYCLQADVKSQHVVVARCNVGRLEQKWSWGFKNETALRNWNVYGRPLKD